MHDKFSGVGVWECSVPVSACSCALMDVCIPRKNLRLWTFVVNSWQWPFLITLSAESSFFSELSPTRCLSIEKALIEVQCCQVSDVTWLSLTQMSPDSASQVLTTSFSQLLRHQTLHGVIQLHGNGFLVGGLPRLPNLDWRHPGPASFLSAYSFSCHTTFGFSLPLFLQPGGFQVHLKTHLQLPLPFWTLAHLSSGLLNIYTLMSKRYLKLSISKVSSCQPSLSQQALVIISKP